MILVRRRWLKKLYDFPYQKVKYSCPSCNRDILDKGNRYIDFICDCRHILFPIPIMKTSFQERDYFMKKQNLLNCPLSVNGINLLMKSEIILDCIGTGDFLTFFKDRRKAITDSEIYNWICNYYIKLKI